MVPDATAPRPAILYVLSIGIMNGLSIGLEEIGIVSSIASRSSFIFDSPNSGFISWIADIADPLINLVFVGSYSCFFNNSFSSY